MTRYLNAAQVLFIHARLIDATGGGHGVRDLAALEAAVARPMATFGGSDLYPDLQSKAGALLESVVRGHPFLGGNKGTGIAAAALMLVRNGWRLTADNEAVAAFVLGIAESQIAFDDIVLWLRHHSDPSALLRIVEESSAFETLRREQNALETLEQGLDLGGAAPIEREALHDRSALR